MDFTGVPEGFPSNQDSSRDLTDRVAIFEKGPSLSMLMSRPLV